MAAEVGLWIQRVAIVMLLVNSRVSPLAGEDRPHLPVDRMPAKLLIDKVPLGLGKVWTIPPDNLLTEARVALGRRLFFDPVLSRDGSTSCASCHDPARSFSTADRLAVGVAGARGTRNSPARINRSEERRGGKECRYRWSPYQ